MTKMYAQITENFQSKNPTTQLRKEVTLNDLNHQDMQIKERHSRNRSAPEEMIQVNELFKQVANLVDDQADDVEGN